MMEIVIQWILSSSLYRHFIMIVIPLFLLSIVVQSYGQASFGTIDKKTAGLLTLGTELEGVDDSELLDLSSEEGQGDKDYSDDVLVIPNEFPETLTRICYPRTDLMKDRFCIQGVDAFALACAGGRPPLQLAPFCTGFDDICENIDFPEDEWCEKDFQLYKRHCDFSGRTPCFNCSYNLDDCSCEPYACLAQQRGYETARWCQKYEIFCNAKTRRTSAEKLVAALDSSIRLHNHCYTLFNMARTICNPFRRLYDFKRCQKFLLDCELLGDFEEEDQEEAFLNQAEKIEVYDKDRENGFIEEGKSKNIETTNGSKVNGDKMMMMNHSEKISTEGKKEDSIEEEIHTQDKKIESVPMAILNTNTSSPLTDNRTHSNKPSTVSQSSSIPPKNPFSHLRLSRTS